ncbi:pyocin activator PrtN family protein [Bradyrhizobium zhanjiangense]|uniref:pyocin activator PrtN family protein n=1 Tax=Bradyrhizobium zhanjiangense TaxID=1325107 RepID=UPI001008AF89|nr:pyocin activator PrtN family protein [Bradyrhizobium zhanjiangense]
MNTALLLMAQYNGMVIPLELLCRDYFQHLTPNEFARKATNGSLDIPVVRIEGSAKTTRGIHLADLAKWIDDRRAAAQKELEQLQGRR